MKLAGVLLSVSIVACSGCAAQRPMPKPFALPDCPAPAAPVLPALDASEPLETPANVARLLERDDAIRAYINGLNAALDCFRVRRETWEMN